MVELVKRALFIECYLQKNDESRAMNDLQSRIQQLTKLILTSQTVDEMKGDQSRPASPTKLDFDLSPYQVRNSLNTTKYVIHPFCSFNRNS